jgi:hypothetical protein
VEAELKFIPVIIHSRWGISSCVSSDEDSDVDPDDTLSDVDPDDTLSDVDPDDTLSDASGEELSVNLATFFRDGITF